MFEFTETITIQAPATAVWDVMTDLESWWVASNPEHESLERLDERGVAAGARLRIREKIAGVRGEYTGELTRVAALTEEATHAEVTMEAPAARYRLLGIGFTVGEGVSWRLRSQDDDNTQLSARVWATFPHTAVGCAGEWVFIRLLNGIAKDREHARTELRYLKHVIETATHQPSA